jgi:hypothetical protein
VNEAHCMTAVEKFFLSLFSPLIESPRDSMAMNCFLISHSPLILEKNFEAQKKQLIRLLPIGEMRRECGIFFVFFFARKLRGGEDEENMHDYGWWSPIIII